MLLSFSALMVAQTTDTASIHGQAFDHSHQAVAGAQIRATNTLSKSERSAQSDGAGYFSLEGLPIAGSWTVTAGNPGFADSRVANLILEGGTGANLTFQLNVAGGQGHVTVTGVAGEVRTDEPQLGDRLDSTQMEETPLFNRRITYLPLLNAANRPAINQADVFMNQDLFTTNGAGRRQTWFEVDGVTGNDSWGRQTIFTNIPLDGVQEMTILENVFSAKCGGSNGSAVNIVTKSGADQFHGDALACSAPPRPKRRCPVLTPIMQLAAMI